MTIDDILHIVTKCLENKNYDIEKIKISDIAVKDLPIVERITASRYQLLLHPDNWKEIKFQNYSDVKPTMIWGIPVELEKCPTCKRPY